jgi:hypothetical protein
MVNQGKGNIGKLEPFSKSVNISDLNCKMQAAKLRYLVKFSSYSNQ